MKRSPDANRVAEHIINAALAPVNEFDAVRYREQLFSIVKLRRDLPPAGDLPTRHIKTCRI